MQAAVMALAFMVLAGSAIAQDRIGVRTGDHPGFGRIVFDWATAPRYEVEATGDLVLVRFPGVDRVDLTGARRLPRNLMAVRRIEGAIELTLRQGARVRHFRNGPKVALDVIDPPAGPATTAAPTPRRAHGATVASISASRDVAVTNEIGMGDFAERPAVNIAAPAPPIHPPSEPHRVVVPFPTGDGRPRTAALLSEAPSSRGIDLPRSLGAMPVPREDERAAPLTVGPRTLLDAAPAELAASAPQGPRMVVDLSGGQPIRARLLQAPGQEPGLRFPAGAGVGAAALRRGQQAMFILDTERPVELVAALRVPGFADLQAQRLPGATLISWTLPPDRHLVLRQEGTDWLVVPVPRGQPSTAAPLRPVVEGDRVALRVEQASQVIPVTDPLSGLPLLIGTVVASAVRHPAARGLAELDLLETFLGVAVLARADRVALHAGSGRFLLSMGGDAMTFAGHGGEESGAAPGMTRSFDIPAQPASVLQDRLRSQQASIGAAPPLRRAEPRFATAQTLLALGLPQEAQAMLRLAMLESPVAAQDGRMQFLSGMAALLAGRATELQGFEAELPSTDEVILWRALNAVVQGDVLASAPGLAATIPLLLSYPEGVRRRLLPIAAEALAQGGHPAAARRLLHVAGDDPSMLLAQASVEEAEGQVDAALGSYAAAAASRDRLQRVRAVRRGIELRLSTGRLDIADAARQLEQTLFAWRGDAQEVATRERLAALRRQAGDPRRALALLRETAALFPEQAAALSEPIRQSFLEALRTDPPLAAVGLYDAYPELLPEGAAGEAMISLLVDRLLALDLRDRAAGLLRRSLESLPAGEGRAALGAQLAALRLGERDADGALEALAISSAPRLSLELLQRRGLVAAQAEARRGNLELATEALRSLGPSGDEALSDILADRRDFTGAAAALSRHLSARAPAAPAAMPEPLQRLVVRNAALLALAGDERGLSELRTRHAAQITGAELAPAFEVLTGDPVRGLADLPRLARELNLFRSLPQSLEPLRTAQQRAG